jgi:hypothetical protein
VPVLDGNAVSLTHKHLTKSGSNLFHNALLAICQRILACVGRPATVDQVRHFELISFFTRRCLFSSRLVSPPLLDLLRDVKPATSYSSHVLTISDFAAAGSLRNSQLRGVRGFDGRVLLLEKWRSALELSPGLTPRGKS